MATPDHVKQAIEQSGASHLRATHIEPAAKLEHAEDGRQAEIDRQHPSQLPGQDEMHKLHLEASREQINRLPDAIPAEMSVPPRTALNIQAPDSAAAQPVTAETFVQGLSSPEIRPEISNQQPVPEVQVPDRVSSGEVVQPTEQLQPAKRIESLGSQAIPAPTEIPAVEATDVPEAVDADQSTPDEEVSAANSGSNEESFSDEDAGFAGAMMAEKAAGRS